MSDARLVWDTWRHILKSDVLTDHVLGKAAADLADLGSAQSAIIEEYARTPRASETNIAMFRQGLLRGARSALRRIPLARRIAELEGIELEMAVEQCVRDGKFTDFGPNAWSAAATLLDWLAARPELASPFCRDVIALERAAIALARNLRDAELPTWPDQYAGTFALDRIAIANPQLRFCSSPAAKIVETAHDLTLLIEDPIVFSDACSDARADGQHNWAVYFPGPDDEAEYAELSPRCTAVFAQLVGPVSLVGLREVPEILGSQDKVPALLALCKLGIVEAVLATRAPGRSK